MPSFKYTDAEPKVYELWPLADYVGKVTACEFSIMQGGKTNGSDAMELTIEFERKNPTTGAVEKKEVNEKLIFHDSTAWKVDQFVKSFNLLIDGAPPKKGQEIEWTEYRVVGLRGWATLGIEEYTSKRDNKLKKINKIVSFITNKEKLSKVVDIPAEASADAHADADEFDRA